MSHLSSLPYSVERVTHNNSDSVACLPCTEPVILLWYSQYLREGAQHA